MCRFRGTHTALCEPRNADFVVRSALCSQMLTLTLTPDRSRTWGIDEDARGGDSDSVHTVDQRSVAHRFDFCEAAGACSHSWPR